MDFRELNRRTVPDRHPLPRVQTTIENLGGNKWFSLLDQGKFYYLLLFISRFVHIEYIQVLEQKDIASPTRFNHLPNPINLETV